MSRKIIIKHCEECPFVEEYCEVINNGNVIGPGDVYYCHHDDLGYDEEKVNEKTIPDWCPLEVDEK